MPAYVDTSALVKRYVAEVGSAWVRRLLAHPAQYVIYTAALSQVEVISALQRRVRDGSLEVTQAQRLAHRVTVHFAQRYRLSRGIGEILYASPAVLATGAGVDPCGRVPLRH